MSFGSSGIVSAAFVLSCAASAFAQTGGSETNFDTSTGWTLTGGANGVVWKADNTPSSVPGGAAQSPTNSLNYNNGTNFNSGSTANTGTATSATLSLSGLQNPTLTFWCNFQTEAGSEDANYGFDTRSLILTPGTGTAVTNKLGVTNAGSLVGACSAMGTWHVHTIALQTSWGTVKVAFKFDTVDGIDNGFAGWFIDTFKVSGSGGGGGNGSGTYAPVQEWKFDSGLQSWTVQSSTTTVTWAADGTPSTVGSAQAYVSAPNSLNYNNGTDYASSAANNGTATSPSVAISSLQSPRLVFQCNFNTESSTSYDKRFLQISKDNFAGTPVLDQQLKTTGADASVGNCSASGTWHTHTVNLDTSWGSVQIRFKFDTVDGAANNFKGWFVDDVKVEAIGGGQTGGSSEGDDGIEGANGDNFCTGSVTRIGGFPGLALAGFFLMIGFLARRIR